MWWYSDKLIPMANLPSLDSKYFIPLEATWIAQDISIAGLCEEESGQTFSNMFFITPENLAFLYFRRYCKKASLNFNSVSATASPKLQIAISAKNVLVNTSVLKDVVLESLKTIQLDFEMIISWNLSNSRWALVLNSRGLKISKIAYYTFKKCCAA